MIDDMSALRECWTNDRQPPSPVAQNKARAALLARIAEANAAPAAANAVPAATRHRRRFGWGWRAGIATVAAAAVAAGFVLAGGSGGGSVGGPGGGTDGGLSTQSDPGVVELAAVYAAAQPFTPPRADQWTYVEFRIVRPGKIAESKGQATDETARYWTRADGKQTAHINDNGRLEVVPEDPHPTVFPPRDYETLAGLPADPQELLNWIDTSDPAIALGRGGDRDERAFGVISNILCNNMLPPAVTASLLRALALVPGVIPASEPVEIDGRSVIAVGRLVEGWLQSDILFDAQTHEFVGSRDVAIADHSFTTRPEGAVGGNTNDPNGPRAEPVGGGNTSGGETFDIKKGEIQSLLIRSATEIVDAPGQTS